MLGSIAATKADIIENVTIVYSNEDRFEGVTKNGYRDGIGYYYYKNGDVYYGEWLNDMKEGFGILCYITGDKYIGYFKQNKKSGFGEYRYKSGDIFRGLWDRGLKNGIGVIYYNDGSQFRGIFTDNKKNGRGYLIDKEGKIFFQLWNMDRFVTQKKMEGLEKNSPEVLELAAPRKDFNAIEEKILKEFGEKIEPLLVTPLPPDAPPEPLSLQINTNVNQSIEPTSIDNKKFGSLSMKQSRYFDTISLMDYKDKLRSIYNDLESHSIEEWSHQDVVAFLEKTEMSDYRKLFVDHNITGAVLTKMTERDFRELGIRAKGDIVKIRDSVAKLKELSRHEVRRKFLHHNKLISENLMSEKLLSCFDFNGDKIIQENSQESSVSEASMYEARKRKRAEENFPEKEKRFGVKDLNEDISKRSPMLNKESSKFDKPGPKLKDLKSKKPLKKDSNGDGNPKAGDKNDLICKTKSMVVFGGSPSFEQRDTVQSAMEDKMGFQNLTMGKNNSTKTFHKAFSESMSLTSDSEAEADHIERIAKDARESKYHKDNFENIEKDYSEYKDLRMLKKKSTTSKHIEKKRSLATLSSQYIINKSMLTFTEKLQEGAYGVVYLGLYLSQKVAIKVYKKLKNTKFHIKSFLKEVSILSNLRHPDILLYMGVCIDGDDCLMISEFLENGSLFDHLHGKKKKTTKLDQELIFEMLQGILRALTYIHSKQILHCDMKSSNILIDESWNIKLADFGLSKKIIGINPLEDSKTSRVGTPNWMAPEICRGEKYTDKADVYSFGLIVWEIVTREVPYRELSPNEIINRVGASKELMAS